MFTRMRVALGISLLLGLMVSLTAFAKGGFDFIAIHGPTLKETVRLTDPALTEDFFTFANFYEDRTKAPPSPGEGYEITRLYIDGKREIVFDRLHYYPETGYVFYDGIENGESEYDGEWYIANPDIKPVFESALAASIVSAAPLEKKQPVTSASQPEQQNSSLPPQPLRASLPSLPVMIVLLATGLTALVVLAVWRRRASVS